MVLLRYTLGLRDGKGKGGEGTVIAVVLGVWRSVWMVLRARCGRVSRLRVYGIRKCLVI